MNFRNFKESAFKAQAENTHHPEFNTYFKNKDEAHVFKHWANSFAAPSKEITKCSMKTILEIFDDAREKQWPVLGQMEPDDLMRTMLSTARHIERARNHMNELGPDEFCDVLVQNSITQAAVALELLRFLAEERDLERT